MKKFLARLCALALILALVVPGTITQAAEMSDDIVVLFTNDVHCEIGEADGSTFGYAHIAGLKKSLEETHNYVTLVDAGDHAQGGVYGVLSQGLWIVDLMNAAGYDIATFGNHEFDYKVPGLKEIVAEADYDYISCNFIDLTTGDPVTEGYEIVDYGDISVAYIGITTPETFSKSTPAYFKNEKGEYIYGFCEGKNGKELYDKVQETIDEVRDDVDYVIALAHLGVDPTSSPWTSYEVIANTTGIDVLIDGHSHTLIPDASYTGVNSDVITTGVVKNADGEEVLLAQTGTKLKGIGQLTITTDGDISIDFLPADATLPVDEDTLEVLQDIKEASAKELAVVAGTATYPLYISNPDDPSERLIRKTETNAGDFVADAYKYVSGAQIAVVNGGGIRVNIPEGEVTVGLLRDLHPFGNVPVLQDNIRFFRDNGVKFLFEEGGGCHADFAEFKAWLLLKWMWNPEQPFQPLADRFMEGYFGKAAPFAKEYLRRYLERCKTETTRHLGCFAFDAPEVFPDDFIEWALDNWIKAEEAVKDDRWGLYAVRMAEAVPLATMLDRWTAKAPRVFVTRHPEKTWFPAKARFAYERLMGIMAEAKSYNHDMRLGNLAVRHDLPLRNWKTLVEAKRPSAPCDRGIVTSREFDCWSEYRAKEESDPDATGGKAMRVVNYINDTGVYFNISNLAYDRDAEYRIRIRVKVERVEGGKGEAFRAHLGKKNALAVNVKDVPDDTYRWYDLGTAKLTPDMVFEFANGRFANGGGRTAVKATWIDCLEFTRTRKE